MNSTNGVASTRGSLSLVAPVSEKVSEKKKRKSPSAPAPTLTKEEAAKEIGLEMAHLRTFMAKNNKVLDTLTAQINTKGDVGVASAVEDVGSILDALDDFKASMKKVFKITRNRVIARLPKERK